MTQPAAVPHDEKSTININSFFQRGIAEFLSRFKSARPNDGKIMRVQNGLHTAFTAAVFPA